MLLQSLSTVELLASDSVFRRCFLLTQDDGVDLLLLLASRGSVGTE